MSLKKAVDFFDNESRNFSHARVRLIRAVTAIAKHIALGQELHDFVEVNGVRYVITKQESQIGEYKYLAYIGDPENYPKDLTINENFDLHDDFRAPVIATTRLEKLEFALNVKKVVEKFAVLNQEKTEKMAKALTKTEKEKRHQNLQSALLFYAGSEREEREIISDLLLNFREMKDLRKDLEDNGLARFYVNPAGRQVAEVYSFSKLAIEIVRGLTRI